MTDKATAKTRLGFIGVGKMGGGMATQIVRAGYPLKVYDTSEDAIARQVAEDATRAESLVEAATDVDVLFTSLPVPEVVREVYGEIFDAERPGLICIDVSTSDPATVAEMRDLVNERGSHYLACPVGRGVDEAASGQSSLFVGGPDDVIDVVEPVLRVIGGSLLRLATAEAAAAFKLVQNMMAMTNLASLCEGYALARKWGVSDEAFAEGLPDSGGWSRQAEIRLGWLLARDFAPRFTIALAAKDLRLASDMASRSGIPVGTGAAALQILVAGVNQGLGQNEVTSMFAVIDQRDGT